MLGGQVSLRARCRQGFFNFHALVMPLSLCKRCAMEYGIDESKIQNMA